MPTFENRAAQSDEVPTELRELAHAIRSTDDPRQIYRDVSWAETDARTVDHGPRN